MHLGDRLSAWINIDGQPCEEYGLTVSANDQHVSCWIASEAGKAFEVHFKDVPLTQTAYCLYVDGTSIGGRVAAKPEGDEKAYKIEGKRVSQSAIAPFMFAPIQQSDNDALLGQSTDGIGEIVLTVSQCSATPSRRYPVVGLPEEKTFHERMKKGIDYQTSYGAPKYRQISRQYKTTLVGEPVTLTFRYRPLDVLRANDIAPRPQPVAQVDDSDSNIEIIETPVKVPKREREMKPEVGRVKKEPAGPPRKKVKREADSELYFLQ